MKKKFFIVVLLTLAFIMRPLFCLKDDIKYIDFDTSMKIAHHKDIAQNAQMMQLYNYLKSIYNSNLNTKISSHLRIPQIIHQIWLGSKLPKEFHNYRQSWQKKHPRWIFIFWTDNTSNYDQGKLVSNFNDLSQLLSSPSL